MTDTPPSWQPDPFHRFAQRYWDGTTWTSNVVDAAGVQQVDPPTASASASATALPVPALVVVGLGALFVLLSDFALSWFSFDGETANFSDLRDAAGQSDDVPFFADQYLSWGWVLGLVIVGLAVAALFIPTLRLYVAGAAVVLAVWHGWTAYEASSEVVSPDIGAWLGSVGFVLSAVAPMLPRNMTVARAT